MIVWQATELVSSDNREIEDSGCAYIVTIGGEDDAEEGVFIRLQSWYEWKQIDGQDLPPYHPLMAQIFGKRVRVTVELLEDEDV